MKKIVITVFVNNEILEIKAMDATEKSLEKIKELQESGCSALEFAEHFTDIVNHCNHWALYLHLATEKENKPLLQGAELLYYTNSKTTIL